MADPPKIAEARAEAHDAVDQLLDRIRDAGLQFGRGELELFFEHGGMIRPAAGFRWNTICTTRGRRER